MHLEFLETQVRNARPNIKDTSVRAYALSLKSIVSPDATDFSELYDHETVLGKLEHYKDTTRKNILNAAAVVVLMDTSLSE